uniref:Uncharacterized protein n=1 Tax=Panagrolaimus superbus TaxID=310955 RepID=A0A914YR02_9BILA
MFRTATYKPAICECDVFREEGDHQNRNAFTLFIYGIALIFIISLFTTIICFREYAEIRQFLYEPCNKTDMLSVQEVKDMIKHSKFLKGMTDNMALMKDMMKDVNKAWEGIIGKAAVIEQEKKMHEKFHKPLNDNYEKGQEIIKQQILERNKCAQGNFQNYVAKAFLRTSSALALIAILLSFFWFIFLFIISTQFIRAKFTKDEFLKVQNRSHKLFVRSLIAMIIFALIMYCQDFYISIYVNTFENALNDS